MDLKNINFLKYFIFQKLVEHRVKVCEAFSLEPSQVELSMGMSTDFEHAVSLSFFFKLTYIELKYNNIFNVISVFFMC